MQQIIDTLAYYLSLVVNALNPINQVIMATTYFADMLPLPSDSLQTRISALLSLLDTFFAYISFLAYFIDLRMMFGCLSIIVAFEIALSPVRVWRLVRSFIT